MCHTVAEEGEVPFARIAGEYVREAVGDLSHRHDVLLLSGCESQCDGLVVDVYVQRDEQVGGIRVLPYSQIYLASRTIHRLIILIFLFGALRSDFWPKTFVLNSSWDRDSRDGLAS